MPKGADVRLLIKAVMYPSGPARLANVRFVRTADFGPKLHRVKQRAPLFR